MRSRSSASRSGATRINRRAFLKLSAAVGAASLTPAPRLSIASTLPLPFPHQFFPNAESLLSLRLTAFDLLLVPAYAAADLIRRSALHIIPGQPGRARDPEGAFTIPYTRAVGALIYQGAPPTSLDDLWTRDALWPDAPRLVIGAALLRRGYSLNDTHPGHLAQAEEDLLRLGPRLVRDPVAGLRSGLTSLALAAVSARIAAAEPGGVFFPPEGAALIEYDWAIPLGAPHPEAALSFVTAMAHAPRFIAKHPCGTLHAPRLTPLTPLPAAALAQRAGIWARLKEITA